MISVGLPKVTLGEVRLHTISLGAERDGQKPKPPFWNVDNLLLEDGSNFLLEDGGCVLLEFTPPHLILESNGKLLQENGKDFILENNI